jgi:aerobic-type carbon monoxide dehydrogenase small subunit (CoxS/CutS family)
MDIRFTLNGEPASAQASPALPALELLRDRFGLMGTKPGCGEGECGACTILLDDEAVCSCLLPAALLEDRSVVTIEGLRGADGSLHAVQRAFVESGAVQCGFCTPGMILRTVAFLREVPRPDDEQIARSVEGNLCRCTGYVKIQRAIRSAAETLAGAAGEERA